MWLYCVDRLIILLYGSWICWWYAVASDDKGVCSGKLSNGRNYHRTHAIFPSYILREIVWEKRKPFPWNTGRCRTASRPKPRIIGTACKTCVFCCAGTAFTLLVRDVRVGFQMFWILAKSGRYFKEYIGHHSLRTCHYLRQHRLWQWLWARHSQMQYQGFDVRSYIKKSVDEVAVRTLLKTEQNLHTRKQYS